MKTSIRYLVMIATLVLGVETAKSQTANFTNFLGGDWNAAANWDLDFTGVNVVPAEGTNANLSSAGAVTVDYNAPMAATSFGALTIDGGATLNVNAPGFTQDLTTSGAAMLTLGSGTMNIGASGVWTATNGGTSTITLGGILNVSGSAYLAPVPTTPPLTISAGGSLNVNPGGDLMIADGGVTAVSGTVVVGGELTISNSANLNLLTGSSTTVEGGVLLLTNNTGTVALGEGGGSGDDNNAGAAFTNNAGQVTFGSQLVIRSRDTRFAMTGGTLDLQGGLNHNCSGNDSRQWFRINGGTANLNAVTINRAVLNSGGLLIQDGVVNSASMRIGIGIAAANSRMDGGIWTNAGAFYIGDRSNPATGTRRTYFVMNGGELVTLGSDGIVINNQGQTTLAAPTDDGGTLDINGGTITAEGIYLNGPAVTANAYARFELSSGTVYLGTLGLIANTSGSDMTAVFTLTGGTLAAKDDWTSSANLPLGGTLTFKAADAAGTARNITLDGVLSSSGSLLKTGAGTLTLNGANTYSGVTTINEGTLALGAAGSFVNTPQITIASGANFDVSTAGGYTLASGKTLAGSGTVVGNFIAAAGATLSPGMSEGTLSFSANLTQSGNVLNVFEISATTNDVIEVAGDLDVSAGLNTVSIIALGGSLAPGTYNLFRYTGSLVGTVGNLDLVGAPGFLTNNTALKTIQLVTTGVRAAASVVWVGNATENVWDVVGHTNWLNGVALDVFVPGDVVRFNDTGSANPNVDIVDNAVSASVTVDATANYTFSGSGALAGTGGLTKTNSGTLAINTVNTYSGSTLIQGGVLEAAVLANGGTPSSIGAAPNAAANLVLDGGALSYAGSTVSVNRGATLGVNGGSISVPTAVTTLTLSGTLTGDGALTKSGAGVLALTAANSYTNGTVINGGILSLGAATSAGAGPITNQNGAVLRLAGSYTMGNNLDFSGTCAVDLNNNSPNGDRHLIGEWTGNATIYLTNMFDVGRTFTIGGNGGMSTLAGVIDLVDSNMRLRFNNGGGNPSTGSPNVHFKLGSGNIIMEPRNGGITINLGALEGGPNTIVRGRASGGSGLVTYSVGALNLDTIFGGAFSNSPAAGNLTALTKVGTGKLTLTGNSTHTGSTTVSAGALQVDGTLGNTTVDVGGSAEATLSGHGTIGGPVTISFLGTLSPGSSVGQLTINNSLTLNSGSTNYFEIDKANGTNDSVVGLTFVSYGGELIVTNLGGTLTAGDTFKLFDAIPGNYFGGFESITLPALTGNVTWNTDNLLVDGTVKVVGPEPPLNFVNNGTSIDFSWSGSFKLQVQTNSLNTGLSNNWSDYPGGGSSPVTVPVDPAAPAVFFRLAEEAPAAIQ